MVLNAIHFLFSSLTASMATILINFQQKFALEVVNISSFNFWTKKISRTLQECFKIFVKLARKMWRFLLEWYLAIDPSNLARENDATELSELQMHVLK